MSHTYRSHLLSFVLLLALPLTLLTGCDALGGAFSRVCTVNCYVDGEIYMSVTALLGAPFPTVPDPSKENHIFLGWYTDLERTVACDRLSSVTGDMDVYAAFTPDAAKLTNAITEELIHGIVTVYNHTYQNEGRSVTSQGSGVIFEISNGYCYLLTNCHVADKDDTVSYQYYEVRDARGETYDAWLYRNPNKDTPAISEKHDLAVLYFKAPEEEGRVCTVPFGADPAVGDLVVTLGTPKGQQNAIAYGKVLQYKRISVEGQDDTKCITFEAVEHDAFLAGGSSGGALLSADLTLIGINYAKSVGDGSVKDRGYTVPISRVREFLSVYVYG